MLANDEFSSPEKNRKKKKEQNPETTAPTPLLHALVSKFYDFGIAHKTIEFVVRFHLWDLVNETNNVCFSFSFAGGSQIYNDIKFPMYRHFYIRSFCLRRLLIYVASH